MFTVFFALLKITIAPPLPKARFPPTGLLFCPPAAQQSKLDGHITLSTARQPNSGHGHNTTRAADSVGVVVVGKARRRLLFINPINLKHKSVVTTKTDLAFYTLTDGL